MANYTNTFDGATKDATNATILAADHDTQYELIETMSATKADKVVSATADNILTMDANGNLQDSGIAVAGLSSTELAILDGATVTTAELNILDGVTATATEINYLSGVTSALQAQLDTKAPLASPALTGSPTAPTQSAGTNNTTIATTAYVDAVDPTTKLTPNTAGTNLIRSLSGTLQQTTTSPTFTKLAQVRVGQSGSVRVNFTMDGSTQFVRLYVNGIYASQEVSNTTGAQSFDTTSLNLGDTVELWGHGSSDGTVGDTLSNVYISINTGNGIVSDWETF